MYYIVFVLVLGKFKAKQQQIKTNTTKCDIGYLTFTNFLVIIASRKASINILLTVYQEHMKHLIRFMMSEMVNRELQR